MEKGKESVDARELLDFQVNRGIKTLSKNFLGILEDLVYEGYLSEEQYKRHRKRVLDYDGETLRNLQDFVSKLEIKFKRKEKGKYEKETQDNSIATRLSKQQTKTPDKSKNSGK